MGNCVAFCTGLPRPYFVTQPQLLIAVLLVQQGMCALMWFAAAYLRIARRASLHWAVATSLVSVGMSLIVLRDQVSLFWSLGVANASIVVGIAALRRGSQIFMRQAPTDGEHLVLTVGDVALLVIILALQSPIHHVAFSGSLVVAWMMLRLGRELLIGLRQEMGRRAAAACALPVFLMGALFLVRAVAVGIRGAELQGSLAANSLHNVVTAFVMLVCGLVINALLLAMTIMRLVQRLRHQTEHDALTDLLNRRAMERLIEGESRRQRRGGGTFALLSVDIDHFKRINDHYGHGVGDEVLKRVADVMRRSCRETDHLARMGGEEFWVLMPGADPSAALVLGERLLHDVRALELGDVATGLKVTISIGLATADAGQEPTELLLRRLDVALYAAKHKGRDRLEEAVPAF